MKKLYFLFSLVGILIFTIPLSAQTTGKIAGTITDAETGNPLPGANIVIAGTYIGAASNLDGSFYIINVQPGTYTLQITMMGYEAVRMENFKVSVNRTSEVNIQMKPTVIEGQEVVVQADKMAIKKDQTSSIRNVSSDEMELLPTESANTIINMQAGVVGGHFRGGRSGEVSYLIDGVAIDNALNRGRTVDIDKDMIQEMEVITGTFNAEYGRAMSGVVNLITKEGSNRIHGKCEGYVGNYYTPHKDIFIGLKSNKINRNQDYKLLLEGPVFKNHLFFVTNVRYQNNKNHLNGIRRFNVTDYSDFSLWPDYYSEATGDSAIIPMNRNETLNLSAKLTYKLKSFKTTLSYILNEGEWHYYSHSLKYAPDGRSVSHGKSERYALQLNHMFSPSAFYIFSLSYVNDFGGNYLYKNPLDPRYVNDRFRTSVQYTGFYTGGQDKGHSEDTTERYDAKFDITWQVNKNHSLKTGISYTQHIFDHRYQSIRNLYENSDWYFILYEPVVYPDSTLYADIYKKEPIEISGYFQDKMEFNEMVINVGVRFDYFDPKTHYPSQRRNPDNKLRYDDPDYMSTFLPADSKYQISPRLGLSYQLGSYAVLHFSYGHFFQTPSFSSMYQNNSFLVGPRSYSVTMGNSQVQAERTVSYEIGLYQQLLKNMGLEVSVFYRDMYDLSTVNVVTTFNQIRYGLYGNKDYGNARGLEVKYDVNFGSLTAGLNYTLQYTRGNADNPRFTFDRLGNSQDPIARLIPMSWDQRHTLNVSLGYTKKNFGISATGFYGSGFPYTFSPIAENRLADVLLYPNNSTKPETFSVDFYAYYDFKIMFGLRMRSSVRVYNLFDRLNEHGVNSNTGRTNQAIVRDRDLQSHFSNFTDYYERINNPANYSTPRQIKFGLGLVF